ncbi:PP2C family protein-serine/threonine phosphatase [Streptomyces sp. BoleA5]|uniref:PP2C family protein-serine/threonine phosphatase n=1 Tax=Streptomyces sp. BoleA5 TaxID=1157637 RepID=UPI001F18999C|nr:PP2C family protein-serine/threonine phosphatase [Streptomyces sp. BoleA5]
MAREQGSATSARIGQRVLRALVESLTETAVLVSDRAGVIRAVNAVITSWAPRLVAGRVLAETAPAWLTAADASGTVTAHGGMGSRQVTARRAELPGGHHAWYLTDVTDARSTDRELRLAHGRAEFLAEASAGLLSSLDPRTCVTATAELAASRLADAAVVVTPPDRQRLRLTRAVAGRPGVEECALAVDPAEVPGLPEALAGSPPPPPRRTDPVRAPDWLLPEDFGAPVSLLVTPLPGNGVPAGALVLMRRLGGPFTVEEKAFAQVFAARAGAAISASVLYTEQARSAALLQEELLPPRLGPIRGTEVAGSYRPSRETLRIGGDFYDTYPAEESDGESTVVLGDVCGKGLEAAVLTGKIRNTLSALRLVETDHVRLLTLLNHALLNTAHARFATMVLAGVTPLGRGQVRLRLTTGGHPAPLILRVSGDVEEAGTSGTLIGAVPDVRATTFTTVLQPGESCLLYSDGVTEARGGVTGREFFGSERLKTTVAGCVGMPVEALVEHVELRTTEWLADRPHDDIALVGVAAPRGSVRVR